MNKGCPCCYVEPCKANCTCRNPLSSAGCSRCCSYGSEEQRLRHATALAQQEGEHRRYKELLGQALDVMPSKLVPVPGGKWMDREWQCPSCRAASRKSPDVPHAGTCWFWRVKEALQYETRTSS